MPKLKNNEPRPKLTGSYNRRVYSTSKYGIKRSNSSVGLKVEQVKKTCYSVFGVDYQTLPNYTPFLSETFL